MSGLLAWALGWLSGLASAVAFGWFVTRHEMSVISDLKRDMKALKNRVYRGEWSEVEKEEVS